MTARAAAALAVIPIVFTGGVILSLSLLALRASSLGFFRQLAPALAVTVAVAMLVSLVFVPALIALLGRFAVWPTRPEQGVDDVAAGRPIGRRIAHLAAGRPLAALIGLACVAVLVVAGLQVRTLHLGVDVISGLPSDSRPQVAARAAEAGLRARGPGPARGDRPGPGSGASGRRARAARAGAPPPAGLRGRGGAVGAGPGHIGAAVPDA